MLWANIGRVVVALTAFGVCLDAFVGGVADGAADSVAAPPRQPNILVIMADDLGFSDLGCYGSEIATPTLDGLAAAGLRFTQFSTTAKCHSSRVSLLSGRWCRQAGDESLRRAVTIPEVLAPAGYFNAMAGKWHLDREPTDFGFDRYFGHLSGATDYFRGDKTFRLGGRPWQVPSEGFYTTVANVDHAIGFLEEARAAKKPWFLYLAFNAPHSPLQPLKEDYDRCLGRYDAGWDAIRAKRVALQNRIGLFGQDVEPAPRPPHIPAWETLPRKTQEWEARRMAAYAALIERMDQEIGRVCRNLESNGELSDTLILFFSDNGACPYDRRSIGRDREPHEPGVKWSDSTGWAWVRNTPFRYYKQNQFEGGIATPAIAHWPAGLKTRPGALVHTPAHLVDVLPTLAEIVGVPVPTSWPEREPAPLAGVSLRPIFDGADALPRPPIHLLFGSDRGMRDGDWKIVSFRGQPWELYDIAHDRTELHDLAADHPEILTRMVAEWHALTADVLQAPLREQAPVTATATQHEHPEWTNFSRAVSSAAGPGQAATSRPNIVLILVDDFGYECVGADGGESYQTPVLDGLAATGMRFEQCHCLPLCTPTRVQLMTGLSNHRNYTFFGHLDPTQRTFGNYLRDAGYVTSIVGKWQLGNDFAGPGRFGFDDYCLWQLTRKPERYWSPGFEVNGREVDYPADVYGPDVLNRHAVEFITRSGRNNDRPFLLYYPMMLVHTPLERTPDSPADEGRRGPEKFADMVAYADKLIGNVVQTLEDQGLRERTLLLVLGDNGTTRDIPSRFQGRVVAGSKGKTTIWGTRVPAIANWPGTIAGGQVCSDLVDSTDFLPTLLEAAGIPVAPDARLDGRSFLPQLLGQPGSPRDWIYAWYGPDGGQTPRAEFAFDARYKLYADGRFFDMVRDEEERSPLTSTPPDQPAAAAQAKLAVALAEFAGPRPDVFARQGRPRVALPRQSGDPAAEAPKAKRRKPAAQPASP